MLLGLGIFDEFVNDIEHKGRQRLPMEQRKSFELQRLVRTVDMHAGLRESFPRELQLLLRIMEYGPDEAWKDSEVVRAPLRAFAGPAPDGVSEAAGPVIERALTRSCSQPERGPPDDDDDDDDPSFIVLTETKFSFRCIPVWDWYSPHRTRVEKKCTCDNALTMTSPVHW
jgi:hypothetical protein